MYGADDDEAEYDVVGMVIKTLVVRMSELFLVKVSQRAEVNRCVWPRVC